MNLIEDLQKEVARNRKVLKRYEKIPTGAFGAAMIRQGIVQAEIAISNMDTVLMIKSLKELRETE